MDLQAAVVLDEAHLPESIHEVADPRSRTPASSFRPDPGQEGLRVEGGRCSACPPLPRLSLSPRIVPPPVARAHSSRTTENNEAPGADVVVTRPRSRSNAMSRTEQTGKAAAATVRLAPLQEGSRIEGKEADDMRSTDSKSQLASKIQTSEQRG
jgi:hypothetical protein